MHATAAGHTWKGTESRRRRSTARSGSSKPKNSMKLAVCHKMIHSMHSTRTPSSAVKPRDLDAAVSCVRLARALKAISRSRGQPRGNSSEGCGLVETSTSVSASSDTSGSPSALRGLVRGRCSARSMHDAVTTSRARTASAMRVRIPTTPSGAVFSPTHATVKEPEPGESARGRCFTSSSEVHAAGAQNACVSSTADSSADARNWMLQ